MHRLLVTCLLIILAASPASASVMVYSFTFSGETFSNNFRVVGSIGLEMDHLTNGGAVQPGVYVWDPNKLYTQYGPNIAGLIDTLNVRLYDGTNPIGTYSKNDYDAVVFDISRFDGAHPVDMSRDLTTQLTNSPGGYNWGVTDAITGTLDPVLSSTGDFQLFASWLNGGNDPPVAPSGVYPFQLATNGGAGDYMQLTSFAPTSTVPEPSTYLLLCLSLGVVGYARRKLVKGEG